MLGGKREVSAMKRRAVPLDFDAMSDEKLANTAATLVFILMGARALRVLTEAIVDRGKRPTVREG